MEGEDVANNTPISSQKNLDSVAEQNNVRAKRILKPRVPYTPTDEDPKRIKRVATLEANKEAAEFNIRVKKAKAANAKQEDIEALEDAFTKPNKNVTAKVSKRPLPNVLLVTSEMQTDGFTISDDCASVHEEHRKLQEENMKLKEALEEKEAGNAALKLENKRLKKVTDLFPTLQQIRGAFVEEFENVKNYCNANLRRQNATDDALRALGDANSIIMYAGVNIANGKLAKAKSAKKLSSRVNFLVEGYWSPDKYKFLGKNKPANCTDEQFVRITEEDIYKIELMFTNLQNDDETRIDEVINTKTTLEFVDTQMKQHLKDLRRKGNKRTGIEHIDI